MRNGRREEGVVSGGKGEVLPRKSFQERKEPEKDNGSVSGVTKKYLNRNRLELSFR